MEMLLINALITILDVRSPIEFAKGHVPGAVNIPLNEIAYRISELKNVPKPIIAYCRSGTLSGIATTFLKQHGINEVYNGGGLQDMLRSAQ